MTPVFYIHLIATLVNMFFIILLWWYNHKLININYQLMQDNIDIRNKEAINKIDAIAKYFDNKNK